MINPWKDYKFQFWETTDGLAITHKKKPEGRSQSYLTVKLTKYGVYRYDYSYNDLAPLDSEHRIRVMREPFDKTKLIGSKKPSFVLDHTFIYNNVKLSLWRDALNPLAIITTPGIPNDAFCLIALTPEGLWRCAGNGSDVAPVDSNGCVLVIRGGHPLIHN